MAFAKAEGGWLAHWVIKRAVHNWGKYEGKPTMVQNPTKALKSKQDEVHLHALKGVMPPPPEGFLSFPRALGVTQRNPYRPEDPTLRQIIKKLNFGRYG